MSFDQGLRSGTMDVMVACCLTFVLAAAQLTVSAAQTNAPPSSVVDSETEDAVYLPECRSALGMQSNEIPDEAISASSSYDEKSVGPLNARIHTERNGGAWCPQPQITKDTYEYLEVDLGKIKVITMVETQGRFGNGQGLEYAPHYILDYQRSDGGQWIRYNNHQKNQMIKGNTNTYLSELRELRPPIIARRVRFIPYSVHPRTICMRVELHGCDGQGVTSYTMPQGHSRGAEVDLSDLTYDGQLSAGLLSGGLGQLTDWSYGETSFRLDPLRTGHKGYGWVGWRNDSSSGSDSKPIEIVFQFDGPREFTAVRLHCNNQFDKDIRVFRLAEVDFSVGGMYYSSPPVQYEYYRDLLIPQARNVTIPLDRQVGRFARLRLYFDARWMLISEVTFVSAPVSGNVSLEVAPPTTVTPPPTTTTTAPPSGHPENPPVIPILEAPAGGPKVDNVWPIHDQTPDDPEPTPPTSNHDDSVRHDNPPGRGGGGRNLDDTYIGIIIGTLAAMVLLLAGLTAFFILRRRRNKLQNGSPLKVFGTDINDLTYGLTSAKLVTNGNVYNAVATADSELHRLTNGDLLGPAAAAGACDSLQARKLPEPPAKSAEVKDNEANQTRDYPTGPKLSPSPLVVSLPPRPVYHSGAETSTPPPPPPHTRTDTGIQGWSGNSVYAAVGSDVPPARPALEEFPREQLQFVEKLGEGQFGEVHLCQAQGATLVAVKMLRPDATTQARHDFEAEVSVLARLQAPNIVRVLGVCGGTSGRGAAPQAVVVEYLRHGDLNQFLARHAPDTSSDQPTLNRLSYGCLIYMSTQIASGMKYLETLNMVHRDLATRNCLVGHNYMIKISDFGMSRSMYSPDYYKMEGRAVLPIRWMAWESVLLGSFSVSSDVWAFAVTLWEVLTFCRQRPYSDLSDQDVLDSHAHCYHGDGLETRLDQPDNCPREIYDLMLECWTRDHTVRPAFREIHMFLSRKNMGYDPRDEVLGSPDETRNAVA